MTKKTKKQLISLALTFASTFLVTIGIGFESVTVDTIELSVIGAIFVSGVRAGLKALLFHFVQNEN